MQDVLTNLSPSKILIRSGESEGGVKWGTGKGGGEICRDMMSKRSSFLSCIHMHMRNFDKKNTQFQFPINCLSWYRLSLIISYARIIFKNCKKKSFRIYIHVFYVFYIFKKWLKALKERFSTRLLPLFFLIKLSNQNRKLFSYFPRKTVY